MDFIKKTKQIALAALILALPAAADAQQASGDTGAAKASPVVVVTGVRFSYGLLEKWIDEYSRVRPDVQIVIESRGSADPPKYDILVDVYPEQKDSRQYLFVGRYAVLPVANSASSFARVYADKGLTNDNLKEVFFHDIFNSSKGKNKPVEVPYTVYTRMQKAGIPYVFASYFGYDQKDIKGTGIAGADSHLLKALQRDTTGVSYLPISLIYDPATRKPVNGLTVLPVDLNGNKKVSDDEKFYDNLDTVIEKLEAEKDIKNIPTEYLHLSVSAQSASPAAIEFLKWVRENGSKDLHQFGYLQPEASRLKDNRFPDLTSGRSSSESKSANR